MIRTADKFKVSAMIKRFAANVIAKRDIDIVFSDKITAEGLHNTNAKGERIIVINPKKATQSRTVEKIVLHEVFHDISLTREGKKLISELKGRSDFDTVRRDYNKRYREAFGRSLKGEQLDEEAAADLLASLLGNERWIKRLATEKPNIVVRAWHSITDLFTYAKDKNLAELRTMRKLLRMYDKAIEESGIGESGTSFSIVELDNGMQYVQASEKQVLHGQNPVEWANQVAHYINNEIRSGNDFIIKTEQGDFLTITRDTAYKAGARNQIKNPDGTYRLMTDAEYKTKLNASVHINELAQVSRKWNKPNAPDTKKHRFAKDGFSYRTAYFKDFDGKYYRLTISVGENGSVSTVYNVGQIKKDALPNGKIKTIYSGSKANSTSHSISISQNQQKSTPSGKKSLSPAENNADEIFAPTNMADMTRNQRRAIKGGKTTASWMSSALLRSFRGALFSIRGIYRAVPMY